MRKNRLIAVTITLASLTLLIGLRAQASATYACKYLSGPYDELVSIPGTHIVYHVSDRLEAQRQVFRRFSGGHPRSKLKNWLCEEVYL